MMVRSDLCAGHPVCCWTSCVYNNLIGLFVVAAIFSQDSLEEEMLYLNGMFSWLNKGIIIIIKIQLMAK